MTKEKLRQYGWLIKTVALLEDQLLELEARRTSTTVCMKQDIISGGCSKDKMSAQVALLFEIRDTINERLQKAYRLKKEIEEAIEVLDHREQTIIRLKYIELKKWRCISDKTGYPIRHVHRLHVRALDKIQKIHNI